MVRVPAMRSVSAGAHVSLRAVSRRYRQGGATVPALADVTFDVEPGSVVGVVGPSGSGKSTLLHLIGALDRPDDGMVAIDGRDVGRLSVGDAAVFRRSVGFVFQHYHLLGHLTALDNVLVPVIPHGRTDEYHDRARALLHDVGLADRIGASVSDLSGGERQRVAIARALVGSPRLLLADEPTGALDSRSGENVLDLLADLQDRHGVTMFLATHDAAVAAQCGRLLRLHDGHIVEDRVVLDPQPDDTVRRATSLG